MATENKTSGELVSIGFYKYGFKKEHFVKCVDCSTEYIGYPHMARCNGLTMIDKCPWCRPDSKQGQHGRAI